MKGNKKDEKEKNLKKVKNSSSFDDKDESKKGSNQQDDKLQSGVKSKKNFWDKLGDFVRKSIDCCIE